MLKAHHPRPGGAIDRPLQGAWPPRRAGIDHALHAVATAAVLVSDCKICCNILHICAHVLATLLSAHVPAELLLATPRQQLCVRWSEPAPA